MKLLKNFVPLPLEQTAAIPLPTVAETEEEEIALKEQFAELIFKGSAPFDAALALIGNAGKAFRISETWTQDAQVKQFIQSFKDAEANGDTRFLPSKSEHIKWLKQLTERATQAGDFAAAANFAKTLTNVLGFEHQKAAVQVQNTTHAVTNVMVVKDHGSDADWERKAVQQQSELRRQALADIEMPAEAITLQ
jgi:hypothetical protein